jgi:hypothetical protein
MRPAAFGAIEEPDQREDASGCGVDLGFLLLTRARAETKNTRLRIIFQPQSLHRRRRRGLYGCLGARVYRVAWLVAHWTAASSGGSGDCRHGCAEHAFAARERHQIGFVLQTKQSVSLSILTSHPPASRNPCPTSPSPSPAAPPMIAPPGPAMAPPVTVPTATSPSVLQIDMATSMRERTEPLRPLFLICEFAGPHC